MDEDEVERQREEAMRLLRQLRRLSLPLGIMIVLIIIALGFMNVPSWLAVPIGILVIIIPALMVGVKIDRMLGIQDFKIIHGIPKIEAIKMVLIGSINVVVLFMAAIANDMSYRLILSIAGILMFLTLTTRQGNRMARMNRAITIKNLPPERRKATEEAYDIVMKKDEGEEPRQ